MYLTLEYSTSRKWCNRLLSSSVVTAFDVQRTKSFHINAKKKIKIKKNKLQAQHRADKRLEVLVNSNSILSNTLNILLSEIDELLINNVNLEKLFGLV